MELDLSKIKKVFFIGVGGIGISALAKMCLARGIKVSGVNDEESLKTLKPLEEEGAKIFYQDAVKSLPEADMYVYSDAWTHRGPEIIENARATGKPVLSYFEALGLFAKEYKVVAVSGTHGKTTTTAMIAEVMVDAGLDPTVIVGSFVKKFNSNFRKGNSEYLVVEADEYNKHFLQFHPFIGAVTNIEADHLDCYKDLDEIKEAFEKFISQSEHKVTNYEEYLEKVPQLSVPGQHNRHNAAVALAISKILGIQEEDANKTLSNFSGTWRRLEKRLETDKGTIIYDDYAHHPTEIKASIEALREIYPKGEKNLTILFQPHLYSRTKALFSDFAQSFKGVDKVMLLPIYFAREEKDESISSDKLAETMALGGDKAEAYPDFKSAEEAVLALNLGSKDVFVTMGAGEAYKVADNVFKISQV